MHKDLKNILLRRRNKVEITGTPDIMWNTIADVENRLKNAVDTVCEKYEMELFDHLVVSVSADKPVTAELYGKNENDEIYPVNLELDTDFNTELKEVIETGLEELEDMRIEKLNLVATMNKNFEQLGYSLNKTVFDKLLYCENDYIIDFYNEYNEELKRLVGADVKYEAMYKNFPREVMDMDALDLYINAIVHYWTFGTYMPVSEEKEKEVTTEHVSYKYIDEGTQEDVEAIIRNIMKSNVSMSAQDKEDIVTYSKAVSNWKNVMPSEMPNKENMVTIANLILKEAGESTVKAEDFNGMFKTATDVLRFIVVNSGGKVTLEALNKVKYPSFSKNMRKLYMGLLDNVGTEAGKDVTKYMDAWSKIAERIHPGDYKDMYPTAAYTLAAYYELLRKVKPYRKEINVYKDILEVNKIFENYTKKLVSHSANDNYKYKYAESISEPVIKKLNELEGRLDVCKDKVVKDLCEKYINALKNDISFNEKQSTYLCKLSQLMGSLKYTRGNVDIVYDTYGKVKDINTRGFVKKNEVFDKLFEIYKEVKESGFKNLNDTAKVFNFDSLHERMETLKTEMKPILDEIDPELQEIKKKNKRVEQKLAEHYTNKDYTKAIKLLEKYPGIFARNLDYLLRNHSNADEILNSFKVVAKDVAIPVLLQVKGHFARRNETPKTRAFMPSTSVSKVFVKENKLEALDTTICNDVIETCNSALKELLLGKESFKKVYIDEQFKKQYIPQGLRSMSKGKETYTRSSRFKLEEANTDLYRKNYQYELDIISNELEDCIKFADEKMEESISLIDEISKLRTNENTSLDADLLETKLKVLENELAENDERINEINERIVVLNDLLKEKNPAKVVRGFIWWTNCDSRVDIDLSAVVYDENYKYKEHLSYTRLRSEGINSCHSGDITNGGPSNGDGVSEFIDLDIDSVLRSGGRYVLFQVNSFTGQHFSELKNVKFGWMEREEVNKGAHYDPKTVKQKLDLSADVGMMTPVAFDCLTREFIWTDLSVSVGYYSNVESTVDKTSAMLETIIDPHKVTLHELIMLNITSRGGEVVEVEKMLEAGDTAFVMDYPDEKINGVNYIRPMDIDIFVGDLMKEATIEEREAYLASEMSSEDIADVVEFKEER